MSRSVEAQQEWISPATLHRRVDVLARYEDFDNIEDLPRIEELHRAPAGSYVLVINERAVMASENEAFDWLTSHGFEDIHLDIVLARMSDVRSAYDRN